MEISATELQPGTFLQNGSYTVLTSLGHGGFGNTYIARQTALQRDVAIKEFFMKDSCVRDKGNNVLPSGDEGSVVSSYKSKFLKEACTIATLNNPHVVHIYDVFEENNTVYYVMELLKGGSLKELVSRHGPLSEERAVRYVVQIAEALYYIHKQGYVHLDVKPANIMLNDFGEAVLIDFGVSKHFSGNGSTTSALYGVSEGYSPLEQYSTNSSSICPATDVYSLGATLLYLLTGNTPETASEVYANGGPSIPSSVPVKVAKAIRLAMSPKISDRPADVELFAGLLGKQFNMIIEENELDATVIADDIIAAPRKVRSKFQIRRVLIPALSVLAGVLLAILIPHLFSRGASGETPREPVDSQVKKAVVAAPQPASATAEPKKAPTVSTSPSATAAPASSTHKSVDTGSSGIRTVSNLDLGYATYSGDVRNGRPHGYGRMKYSTSHIIDDRDPNKNRAEAGDYVEGDFSEGHLVQGNWYGGDGEKKGFIVIGG